MGDAFFSNEQRVKSRILVLAGILGVLLGIYALKLLDLQVIQGSLYRTRAVEVTQRSTVIPAMRGEFYDRSGDLPMVLNVDSFAIKLIPAEVPKEFFPQLYINLTQVLGSTVEEWQKKIPENLYRSYLELELKDGLEFEQIAAVAQRIQDFPGVFWTSKPRRNYVESGSLSHIIGYVGNITQEELQTLYNQGYNLSSVLGKTGLEKRYDQVLRGVDGARYRTVDVRGREVHQDSVVEVPPQNGKDIVLTIDRKIQKLAEDALGPRLGSVIVLKPSTGEILAMVSYPYFDANLFYTDRASQEFNRLFTDPKLPFWNRAIKSEYPPASTFKSIMGAAVLERTPSAEGKEVMDPFNQFVTCTGSMPIGDRVFRCWKSSGHGPQNLSQAVANSCNIYFYTAGLKYLGPERIGETARSFGLGQITGIDLPGESSGLVPTPKWKQRNLNYPWLGGDTVNMSIGQGFTTVTPLQMANVIAMIVNEGTVYKPHFLKSVRDRITGKIMEETQPEILLESSLDKSIFKELQADLRQVVTWGTAHTVFKLNKVQVAGKTGTGEAGIKGSNNHGWFVSYGPYDSKNPDEQVVVVVQIEAENAVDDWWAPKAADLIFQGIFTNQTFEELKATYRPWYLRF